MRAKDILIDMDDDFPEPEVLPEFGTWRRSLRSKFPPHQVEVNARTRAVDKGIQDTHLQQGLKDHRSTPARRGEVCCISFLVIQILVICMC